MATLPHRARNTDRFELNRSSWQAAGLKAWWPLGAYPDARDMSLFSAVPYLSIHATRHPTAAAAEQRAGLRFDGAQVLNSSDVIQLLYNGQSTEKPVNLGTEDFTICAWIRSEGNGTAWQTIFANGYDPGYALYVANEAANGVLKMWVDDNSLSGTTDVRDSQWHHVMVVRKSYAATATGDLIIYLDGVQEASNLGSVNWDNDCSSTSDFSIGGLGGSANYSLKGLLDDVRVYARAFSPREAAAIYHQTRDGGYGDLAVLPTRRIGIDPLLFPPGGIIGTASVSPVTAAWSTPAVTATHSIVISASASPVTAAWSVPAVTATYATAPSASVSPVTAAWGVPAVTATRTAVFSASASPVTTTWSTPAVTATHATSHSASVSPVTAAWSTTATTATYAAVLSASASPVTAAWSVPSMTATTSAVALPTVFYSTRGLSTVSMAALGTANAEAELVGAGGVSLLVKGK